ncbi:hypothetical protein [Kribbella sp. NPDC050470]|uniref:hypothetical protein n=1 Tax=unclassified Kribbella TaxID=2644121 RepID=UPI00378D8695
MNTQTVAFTVPLLPGMTEVDRKVMTSCWHGERRSEYEASRRRLGIVREQVWIQPTPDGDVAVAVLEAVDIAAALAGVSTSTEAFDSWFRDHCRSVHGIDLEAGFPPPEMVLDYRV